MTMKFISALSQLLHSLLQYEDSALRQLLYENNGWYLQKFNRMLPKNIFIKDTSDYSYYSIIDDGCFHRTSI